MLSDFGYKGRTVAELIAALRHFPADMPVRVQAGEEVVYDFSIHADRLDEADGWDGDPCEVLQLDITG